MYIAKSKLSRQNTQIASLRKIIKPEAPMRKSLYLVIKERHAHRQRENSRCNTKTITIKFE